MSDTANARRGRFVDEDVDTSGFTFWEGNPAIPGAPGLGEEEEKLRLETLHSLVKISDTDDPVLMSMCRLVRSVLRVPVAGEPFTTIFRCCEVAGIVTVGRRIRWRRNSLHWHEPLARHASVDMEHNCHYQYFAFYSSRLKFASVPAPTLVFSGCGHSRGPVGSSTAFGSVTSGLLAFTRPSFLPVESECF